MGYVSKRIYLYHKLEGLNANWNTTVDEDLSDEAVDIVINKGIKAIKDTFSFNIYKADRYFNPSIRITNEDMIKVWLKRDSSSFTDSDLLITGIVNNVGFTEGTDSKMISVTGNDFSEIIFDISLPIAEKNKTCAEMIKILLSKDPIVNKGITFTNASIPSDKHDGTPFPNKSLGLNYTPVFQILDKLCSNEFTGDGEYYYYVDTSKVFHFCYKSGTVESITIDPTLINIEDIKIDKSKEEVKNFIILNCGVNLDGNDIEDNYYDETSIAKVGFKHYFAVEETISCYEDVLKNEIDAYRLSGTLATTWGSDIVHTSSGTSFVEGDWVGGMAYPKPNNAVLSGGNTYIFYQKDGSTTLTATSNSTFNTHATTLAINMGKDIGKRLCDESNAPKYETKISFPFRTDLILGGLYPVKILDRGIDKNLRLSELTISLSGVDGKFEEDIGSFEVIG